MFQDLVETTIEFNRLEKVEVGGVKGKALSKQIENLYLEFNEFVQIFQNITYNCLDIKLDVSFIPNRIHNILPIYSHSLCISHSSFCLIPWKAILQF